MIENLHPSDSISEIGSWLERYQHNHKFLGEFRIQLCVLFIFFALQF